jgi:nucleoside-diphosphate-sugar epimerase
VICYATGGDQDRRALYVEGGRRLARLLPRLDPGRLVYVSSTSALPNVDGEVDETCDLPPDTDRGRVQREAEQIFQDAARENRTPWVILRLAGLYGPDRPIARIYRKRQDPLPGDGMTATNLIHLDDAAAAVVAAVELDPETSAVVHVCDDEHTPRRHMYARAAKLRGEAPPAWERNPPADAPIRGKRVSNSRLHTILGVSLRHPHHVLS